MGRREFYAWVEQANREQGGQSDDVETWEAADNDEWWVQARRRRDEKLASRN